MFPLPFPEHPCDDKPVGGYLGGADGTPAGGLLPGGITVGTPEHMHQRVLRAVAVACSGPRRCPGVDDGVHPFTRLEHRAAEGARFQHLQPGAAPIRHVVCQGGVVLTFQV